MNWNKYIINEMPNKGVQFIKSHKLVILLSITSLVLFISTVTLATKIHSNSSCTQHDVTKLSNTQINIKRDRNIRRLTRTVKPINYKLKLAPNLQNSTFDGSVDILVEVTKSAKEFVLHSHSRLSLKSLYVKYQDLREISNYSNIVPNSDETISLPLPQILEEGLYIIVINFSGRLDKTLIGFYESTLKNGKKMVASKFEPTYARQAFPCFDEPDFKATFDITLVKPLNYTALSNMNEISATHDNTTNTDIVKFATSVPMSTYLACFVICDFDNKETTINTKGIGKNFILRSYARKGEMHKIDFAHSIAQRATEYYIQYYEVPFPLPKLDMIAIPDYQSGATEHWGLITYRETSFLVDEKVASATNKIAAANTIAHELAHMWFGNLVTMKWWDEIWLNEGFATYMQVKAINAIEPSWTMLDQFLTKTLHTVLVTDAKLSSHSIVQSVETPDEITAIFDHISYNKGSSVLRMLEGFVGEENFRKGVSDYLKKYKFGNTITQDLLDCLVPYFEPQNKDLNLSYIMDTWTRQTGYPYLTVTPADEPNKYTITQSRFLIDPDAVSKNDSQFEYRWFVPITYKTNNGPSESIKWFPNCVENVTIKLNTEDKWIKINNNQVGFYRVNYADEMWQDLIEQLKNKSPELTISDRAHLLNDVFALAEGKRIHYEMALNLSTYLTVEDAYVPWRTAFDLFYDLMDSLRGSNAFPDLQKYLQHLTKPLYNKLSWEKKDDKIINSLLRSVILNLATKASLPDAKSKVRSMFLQWLENHGTKNATIIEPDLRNTVYYYGMKSGTQKEWDKLFKIYLNESDVQELSKLRSALAAPEDLNILKGYLNLAWDEKNVRGQDYFTVLQEISTNPSGVELIWSFVRENWPKLVERFTLNSRYLGNMIKGVTKTFDTEDRLKEIEEFYGKFEEAGAGESARREALETVKNNIKWAKNNKPAVKTWLKNYVDKL